MSFWFIKSSNESIGIVTLGTVSIAVRMPLYEKINTSVVKNHVIATNWLAGLLGCQEQAKMKKEKNFFYSYFVDYWNVILFFKI